VKLNWIFIHCFLENTGVPHTPSAISASWVLLSSGGSPFTFPSLSLHHPLPSLPIKPQEAKERDRDERQMEFSLSDREKISYALKCKDGFCQMGPTATTTLTCPSHTNPSPLLSSPALKITTCAFLDFFFFWCFPWLGLCAYCFLWIFYLYFVFCIFSPN
jgi:hypothetical protein